MSPTLGSRELCRVFGLRVKGMLFHTVVRWKEEIPEIRVQRGGGLSLALFRFRVGASEPRISQGFTAGTSWLVARAKALSWMRPTSLRVRASWPSVSTTSWYLGPE